MERLGTILSLLSVGLVATLLPILLWRRLVHKFPLFFIYVISSLFSSILRFSVSGNYQLYFRIFWATEALYAVLALLALYEAFHDVFILDYEAWPWFWMVFPGAVLMLSTIFVGHALLYPPTGVPPLIALILSFETVVNCVKGGLLVMFLSLAWLLGGESWLTYPYGVVLGFAVSSFGSLLSYWLYSFFGTRLHWLGKYGPPMSYIVAVLIWIASCFLPPEPKDRWHNFDDPEKALATVRQYVRALRWIAEKDR